MKSEVSQLFKYVVIQAINEALRGEIIPLHFAVLGFQIIDHLLVELQREFVNEWIVEYNKDEDAFEDVVEVERDGVGVVKVPLEVLLVLLHCVELHFKLVHCKLSGWIALGSRVILIQLCQNDGNLHFNVFLVLLTVRADLVHECLQVLKLVLQVL